MPGGERHVERGGINYVVEQLDCEHPAQYMLGGPLRDLLNWMDRKRKT